MVTLFDAGFCKIMQCCLPADQQSLGSKKGIGFRAGFRASGSSGLVVLWLSSVREQTQLQ